MYLETLLYKLQLYSMANGERERERRCRWLELRAADGDELARHVEPVQAAPHVFKRGARRTHNKLTQLPIVDSAAEVVAHERRERRAVLESSLQATIQAAGRARTAAQCRRPTAAAPLRAPWR